MPVIVNIFALIEDASLTDRVIEIATQAGWTTGYAGSREKAPEIPPAVDLCIDLCIIDEAADGADAEQMIAQMQERGLTVVCLGETTGPAGITTISLLNSNAAIAMRHHLSTAVRSLNKGKRRLFVPAPIINFIFIFTLR